MRKLLLGSTALVMLAAPAFALDSDTITVTTQLDQACSVDVAGTDVALPADGSPSAIVPFTYECNYGGEAAVATVTYDSGFDGVSADAGVTDHVYNIVPTTGGSGTSAVPLVNAAAPVTAPNTTQNASFQLDLVAPIVVAGTYTDVLTISIAP